MGADAFLKDNKKRPLRSVKPIEFAEKKTLDLMLHKIKGL